VFCWPLVYGLCNSYLCVEPRPAAEPMPIAEPHPLLQPHPPVGTQPTLKTVGADEGVGTVDDPMIIASDEELQGEDEEVTSAFSGNARNKVSWWTYVQRGCTCAYSIWMSKQHRCTYSMDIQAGLPTNCCVKVLYCRYSKWEPSYEFTCNNY